MELLQWFIMGILFASGAMGMGYLSVKVLMPWFAWGGMISGGLMIMVGLGWTGASFLEQVPQSGAMGMAFFCLPGLMLIAAVLRRYVPKNMHR